MGIQYHIFSPRVAAVVHASLQQSILVLLFLVDLCSGRLECGEKGFCLTAGFHGESEGHRRFPVAESSFPVANFLLKRLDTLQGVVMMHSSGTAAMTLSKSKIGVLTCMRQTMDNPLGASNGRSVDVATTAALGALISSSVAPWKKSSSVSWSEILLGRAHLVMLIRMK